MLCLVIWCISLSIGFGRDISVHLFGARRRSIWRTVLNSDMMVAYSILGLGHASFVQDTLPSPEAATYPGSVST